MKIALHALGCRTNQAEIDELKQNLKNKRVNFVNIKEKADIYVINTCSVTMGAERDTRRIFRRIKNQNPSAKIYALGCLQNKNQPDIDAYFKNWQEFIKKINIDTERNNKIKTKKLISPRRSKAFIKIQDGCNFNCAFCITKILRGKSRSHSPKKIIHLIQQKEQLGCEEIVLTGINILMYNYQNLDFISLMEQILQKTSVKRIRFGSIDPRLLNDKIINLWENPHLMPHMHFSIQSGSSEVLKKMNRNFSLQKTAKDMEKLRKINPSFGFSCDIIVGFPGETEKDFQDTMNFIVKQKFFKIHVFPYSDRPETEAVKLKNKITEKNKKMRLEKILTIDKQLRKNFQQTILNQKISVMWERKRNDQWLGYAENFLKVQNKSDSNLKNKITKITFGDKNILDY